MPNFSRTDREDYFSLDKETQKLVNTLRQTETRIYFILLLGYFRSRPIVFSFTFADVEADYSYIKTKYFNDKNVDTEDLPPRTKTALIKKLLSYTGFSIYQSKLDNEPLLKRLNDVVKINLEPRYVFDECIAYFGQNRIALAGCTTLQDTISTVLSNERNRIETVLNDSLSSGTRATLLSLDLPTSHLTFGNFPSDDFMRSILSAINNMLLEILAASAYKEYRERERKQKEGIVKAQQKGLYHGRQPNLESHDRIASFTEAGFSINKTAEAVGVSRSTEIRVRKKLNNLS